MSGRSRTGLYGTIEIKPNLFGKNNCGRIVELGWPDTPLDYMDVDFEIQPTTMTLMSSRAQRHQRGNT